jgi:hypothetical protein
MKKSIDFIIEKYQCNEIMEGWKYIHLWFMREDHLSK